MSWLEYSKCSKVTNNNSVLNVLSFSLSLFKCMNNTDIYDVGCNNDGSIFAGGLEQAPIEFVSGDGW